jgi:xanthine dehydrogenase accessory factor
LKELEEIVRAWREAAPGQQMVLITVVDIRGSSYKRPGARLLVVGEKSYGSISGGCLEADLIESAWERTRSGPAVATFDTTSEEDALWGYGLGCRGVVTALMRRLGPSDGEMRLLETHLAGRSPSNFGISIDGGSLGKLFLDPTEVDSLLPRLPPHHTAGILEELGGRVFVERLAPVIALNVFGAGFDALPLVEIAAILGWRVSVFDHRPGLVSRDRFPTVEVLSIEEFKKIEFVSDPFGACVVMTHSLEKDRDILAKLADETFGYLGVLGPRDRTKRLLADFERSDLAERIYSPIGLDIGAESPHEIALAIVAEIQAVFAQRAAGFLKDRLQKIHPPLVVAI